MSTGIGHSILFLSVSVQNYDLAVFVFCFLLDSPYSFKNACDTQCPPGYWLYGNCSRGQPTECKRCSEGCPAGMYIARPCTAHSDLVCRACRPLCISEEFEFTPCKGSSNRECRRKDIIPEIVIPNQHSVWFEDQRYVKDVSFILTPDTQRRLLANRSVILDRGSGYQ
ncbi:unnamed protein product, partial [Dibothriocephalus latus]